MGGVRSAGSRPHRTWAVAHVISVLAFIAVPIMGREPRLLRPSSVPTRILQQQQQQQQGNCPASAFNVTTALYVTASPDSLPQLAGTLASCLGQAPCQVRIAAADACTAALQVHSQSLSDFPRNCTAGSLPVYACKGIAVSPELFAAATGGRCADSWQLPRVQCPGAQLQRAVYASITSGQCSAECAAGQGPQALVAVPGPPGQCMRLALQVAHYSSWIVIFFAC